MNWMQRALKLQATCLSTGKWCQEDPQGRRHRIFHTAQKTSFSEEKVKDKKVVEEEENTFISYFLSARKIKHFAT